MKVRLRDLKRMVREALHLDEDLAVVDEVDTDPSNNPGRPDDPYDYLGMHPAPEAAMSPPHAGAEGGEGGADPSEPPDEPPETE